MKALIFNGKVIQIEEQEFEIHSDFSWVDCDSSIKVGFVYDGTTFSNPYPELTTEEKLERLRAKRNIRLSETDWWVLPDRTATQAQLDYRQALRDITDTYTSLDDVVWPTKP